MTTGISVYVLLQREEVNSTTTVSQLLISYSGRFGFKWCCGWHRGVNQVKNTELAPRLSTLLFSPLQADCAAVESSCVFFWDLVEPADLWLENDATYIMKTVRCPFSASPFDTGILMSSWVFCLKYLYRIPWILYIQYIQRRVNLHFGVRYLQRRLHTKIGHKPGSYWARIKWCGIEISNAGGHFGINVYRPGNEALLTCVSMYTRRSVNRHLYPTNLKDSNEVRLSEIEWLNNCFHIHNLPSLQKYSDNMKCFRVRGVSLQTGASSKKAEL